MKLHRVLILVLLIFSFSFTRSKLKSSKQETEILNTEFDSLRAEINSWIQEKQIPSASIAVAKAGEIIWQETLGYSNRAKSIKAETGTIYPIASITKSITATGIMLLVEEGKIKLGDKVSSFFGTHELRSHRDINTDVTIKQLLNHTSGLDMYYNNLYADEPFQLDNILRYIDKYGVLMYPPGERFVYSNFGYMLLGEIISLASGLSYEAFLQERLFDPLEMKQTTIRVDKNREKEYATLYGAQQEELPFVYTDTKGAGDVYSTAGDLAKYGMFHLGQFKQGLLSEKTLLEMRTSKAEKAYYDDPCQPYGLGWFFEEKEEGINAFWHEGGLDGTQSILKMIPSEDLVIAVIINTTFTNSKTDEITNKVLNKLIPDYAVTSCGLENYAAFQTDVHFTGKWRGKIYTYADTLDLNLEFTEDSEVISSFYHPQTKFIFSGNQPFPIKMNLVSPYRTGNHLVAWLPQGIIPSNDINEKHHVVQLDLRREASILRGTAKAFSANTIREGFGIAYYAEFSKTQ